MEDKEYKLQKLEFHKYFNQQIHKNLLNKNRIEKINPKIF